jgi:hypothetical protein
MLGQFRGDRVGHDLAAVDLRRLASIDRGMPSRLGIAVDSNQKPAGADPLLHDFFELGGRLPLLIHAVFLRVNFGSTGLVGQAKHRLNG